MDRKQRGAVSEAKVTSALLEEGAFVSDPIHRNLRYDLVADFGGDLYRVQVKTAYKVPKKNSFRVDVRCRNEHGNSSYSEDEIDAFAVYVPEHDAVYWYWFSEIDAEQFGIYDGDWEDLSAPNKARVRNPNDYLIENRNI